MGRKNLSLVELLIIVVLLGMLLVAAISHLL
jgi:Tfp pilus assembly protein PilE